MQHRSMVKMLLLTIITLGIYQIYWTYQTRQELVSQGQNVPRFIILMAPLLAILGMTLLLVINAFVFSQTDGGNGLVLFNALSFLIGIVAFVAAIPITFWWFYKYCKAAEQVTAGKLTFDLSYVLFIVTAFFGVTYVWPFIVQYNFNEVVGKPAVSGPSKAPTAPDAA